MSAPKQSAQAAQDAKVARLRGGSLAEMDAEDLSLPPLDKVIWLMEPGPLAFEQWRK